MRTAPTTHPPRRRSLRIGVSVIALAAAGVLAGQAAASSSTAASAAGLHSGSLAVSKALFGYTVEPYTGKETAVYRYTLTNDRGMSVKILSYGAIVNQIDVPDAADKTADVVLGFSTLADYVAQDSPPVTANGGPYFGESIGRYGNRIADGTFTLDQPAGPVTYHLPINNNGNTLHGGLVGFGNHVWSATEVHGSGDVGVQLTLVSPNGDQGFPATLKDVVTYTLNNQDQLVDPLRRHRRVVLPQRPVQGPQHGHQPDQPQLLQPGRGVLRGDVRPEGVHQRELVHPDHHHADPDRQDRLGQGHAVRLHQPGGHRDRRADQRGHRQ
jgi:hypothetical protein